MDDACLRAGCASRAHLQTPWRLADPRGGTATAASEDGVTFLHFLVIAVVGVILLGTVRDRQWLRGFAIAVTGALAIGASAAAFSLFALGRQMRWTSEAPSILGVVLALVLCSSFMLLAWSGVRRQLRTPRGGSGTLRAGLFLLGVGVMGAVATGVQHQRTSRPSHDVEVVALAFDAAGERIFSLDRGGTLKTWDADDGDPVGSWHDPSLASAARLEIAPGGHHALVAGAGGVRVLDLDSGSGASPVTHFPEASDGAFLGDDTIALARGRQVAIVTVRAGGQPLRTLEFGAEIEAIASAGGTLAVATRDGSVEAAPRWMSFGHVGLLGDDLLVAAGDRMPELLSLRLPAHQTAPFLNHGIGVTALAAAPGRGRIRREPALDRRTRPGSTSRRGVATRGSSLLVHRRGDAINLAGSLPLAPGALPAGSWPHGVPWG